MATRTISAAGGNWSALTAWVEGAVPTAADDVVATALSGNLTVNGTSGSPSLCRSADFTGYVGTLTMNTSSLVWTIGDASGGKLILVAGMTYVPNSQSTINFISTTTGNNITTAGKTMPNVVFNGSGGAWTITDAYSSARDITMTLGSVTANSTVGLRQFLPQGGTFTLNGGDMTLTSACTQTIGGVVTGGSLWSLITATTVSSAAGSLTFKNITATGSYSNTGGTVTVNGDLNSSTGTLSAGTTTVTGAMHTNTGSLGISGTAALAVTGALTTTSSFSNTSTGTVSMGSAAFGTTMSTTAGTFTVNNGNVSATNVTMSGSTLRTINLGNGTWTISGTGVLWSFGSAPTNLTLNAGSSTVDFTDTSATVKSATWGGQTMSNVRVRGAASCGACTFGSAGAAFTTLTLDADSNVKLANGKTFTPTSLIVGGTSGHTVALASDSAGVKATLACAAANLSIDYTVMQDIQVGPDAVYAGANSTDTSGNAGWIFAAKPPSGQSFVVRG